MPLVTHCPHSTPDRNERRETNNEPRAAASAGNPAKTVNPRYSLLFPLHPTASRLAVNLHRLPGRRRRDGLALDLLTIDHQPVRAGTPVIDMNTVLGPAELPEDPDLLKIGRAHV